MNHEYVYKAFVIDVYDGDTITVEIDLGFHLKITEKLRLIGIDTPEIRTRDLIEKQKGFEARDYLRSLILYKDVIVKTYKQGKYGRYLAEIYLNNESINQRLLNEGYANPYPT